MDSKEIDIVANKVADILIGRYKEEQQKNAEIMANLIMNAPIKGVDYYENLMKGKTVREGLDELKNL